MDTKEFKDRLVLQLSKYCFVKGIGQTGDSKAPLIPGQSDIDLFVLCTQILTREQRMIIYSSLKDFYATCRMAVCDGGLWGYGDILSINGIDVMPMYFTIEEMTRYIEETLQGDHIKKEGQFYPTGRLASVETIQILYEEEQTWSKLVEKVKTYPSPLFARIFHHYMPYVLDKEALGRVLLRKEVLFYHQVLEEAIDNFLQALFAINHRYFPSRKRTSQYIEQFDIKPVNCNERLLQIVENASHKETMEISVKELITIAGELKELGEMLIQE